MEDDKAGQERYRRNAGKERKARAGRVVGEIGDRDSFVHFGIGITQVIYHLARSFCSVQ